MIRSLLLRFIVISSLNNFMQMKYPDIINC